VEQGNSNSQIKGSEYPEIKLRKYARSKTAPAERHWVRGDPFATAFFNALSVVFPLGETFMIRSVSAWKDKLPEPLDTNVSHFIYQEAAHCRHHNAENNAISASGYDITPLENSIRSVVNRLQNIGPIGSLCGTMCIEHLTAIMSSEIVANDHLDGAQAGQRDFWEWHAIEEIEHKAVAFDLWHYALRGAGPCDPVSWQSLPRRFWSIAAMANWFCCGKTAMARLLLCVGCLPLVLAKAE
jgi:predicted metal-dependent hydrolase